MIRPFVFKFFLTALLLASSAGLLCAQSNGLSHPVSGGGNSGGDTIQPAPTPVHSGGNGDDIQPTPTPSPVVDDGESDWGNASGTDWNTVANWTGVAGGSAPPAPGDVAWFTGAKVTDPNLSSSVSISGLYFSATNSSNYTLSNSNDATLTLTGSAGTIGAETGDSTAVAIGANNTSGTNTISAPIILAPTSGTTSTIFQEAGGTLTLTGVISGGNSSFGIAKKGGGILILSGPNSYSGATTISASGGTLSVDSGASGTGRLAGTSGITVNSGGTLLLAQSGTASTDRINDSATITLAGGKFATGGLSEGGTGTTRGLGALTLTASSTIDMGSGASILNFGGTSTRTAGILTIDNWSGDKDLGGGTDQIIFANTLDSTFLANIDFTGFSPGAIELGTGEVVPLPEPSTWAGAALAMSAVLVSQRRRLLCLISPNLS